MSMFNRIHISSDPVLCFAMLKGIFAVLYNS